ncbi:MAG: class I SAM-dependent methyltransferase, partial [Ignisphaera sp.]
KEELRAGEVYGVDIDEQAVALARKRGIEAYIADLSKDSLPFPNEFFDLVLSLEVIEHLANPDNMLKEAYRVLRKGGYLLISTPNLGWWINRAVLLLGYQPYLTNCSLYYDVGKFLRPLKTGCTGGHLRLYTFRALKELLEVYKCHIVKVKATTISIVPTWIRPFDALIAKLRPSLGLNIVMLARK